MGSFCLGKTWGLGGRIPFGNQTWLVGNPPRPVALCDQVLGWNMDVFSRMLGIYPGYIQNVSFLNTESIILQLDTIGGYSSLQPRLHSIGHHLRVGFGQPPKKSYICVYTIDRPVRHRALTTMDLLVFVIFGQVLLMFDNSVLQKCQKQRHTYLTKESCKEHIILPWLNSPFKWWNMAKPY